MTATRATLAAALKEVYGMPDIKQFNRDRKTTKAGAGPTRKDVEGQTMGLKRVCPRCGKRYSKGLCPQCGVATMADSYAEGKVARGVRKP